MLKHNFVARNCVKVQEPALDAHEFVRVVELPLEDSRSHVRSGKMTDVAGGLLHGPGEATIALNKQNFLNLKENIS